MSADLNWASRGGIRSPHQKQPVREPVAEEMAQLLESERANDWHTVLHYLRVCCPALDRHDLAQRRVTAYAALGLHQYANAMLVL